MKNWVMVTDVMTLHAPVKELCNVWTYHNHYILVVPVDCRYVDKAAGLPLQTTYGQQLYL